MTGSLEEIVAAPFLPISGEEMEVLGWDCCDIVIVSGDAYVDHPSFGAALIGRYLESLGYRVGIIPQPNPGRREDLLRLGRPRLFAGVASGAVDSMVGHYTSLGKRRSSDSYSPGGRAGLRPDRAVLRYVNAVQRAMPGVPVVIGGIEASLRRLSHYDFWSDRVRKSVLLDSKADILVYGMGEKAAGEIAAAVSEGSSLAGIRGTAVYGSAGSLPELCPGRFVELPSHEEVVEDPRSFMEMTRTVELQSTPWSGSTLVQRADSRAVVVNPPQYPLSTDEMDAVYGLPFAGAPHPSYREAIPAFDMVANSITVVRGCSGGCTFCSLGLHQGRFITSRSARSVEREAAALARRDCFRGTVTDLGGPSANLYGLGCGNPGAMKRCGRPSCLHPDICPHFRTEHGPFMELIDRISSLEGVSNVYVSSGIRFDVALRDPSFVRKLASGHVPGLLKIAPEHFDPAVLELMRKPSPDAWREFVELFQKASEEAGREQYIEPYLIAAFPGCDMRAMETAARELERLGMRPPKVQVFLPSPMTLATAMYRTGLHPSTGEAIYVQRKPSGKERQLRVLPGHSGRLKSEKMQ